MSMPPPKQLARGKSSTSLAAEGKKKPVKQFTAGGIKAHNRNSSYGQLNKMNRLTRIVSVESVEEEADARPAMSRSKSSDGVVLKRNKSKRKLAGLAPLTRTASSQSHKGKGSSRPGKAQATFQSGHSDSEEEVDSFDGDAGVVHSPGTRPDQDHARPEADSSMPQYFGHILSQSTGVERTLMSGGPGGPAAGEMTVDRGAETVDVPRQQQQHAAHAARAYEAGDAARMPRTMSRGTHNDSQASLRSANLIFQPSSTSISRHYQQGQMQAQPESRGSSASLATDFTKNFREFLNPAPEPETRTQQKLWLQRESSILDLTHASKSHYQLNNAQFRTEFEQFAREYLNVRRNVNPVAGSLKRLEAVGCRAASADDRHRQLSTFAEFAPGAVERIRANHSELSRIWESGWRDFNTSSSSMRLSGLAHATPPDAVQQVQQRPKPPAKRTSNEITFASPQAPITKAIAKNEAAMI